MQVAQRRLAAEDLLRHGLVDLGGSRGKVAARVRRDRFELVVRVARFLSPLRVRLAARAFVDIAVFGGAGGLRCCAEN